jgi:uncharacterized RDD family membrane protein YckC
MNPSETQSEAKLPSQYFDPEQPDNSEQQFAVSLEQAFEVPQFFVEQEDDAAPSTDPIPLANNEGVGAENTTRLEAATQESAISEDELAAEKSGEDDWRNLVSERVSSYKSRRPRPQRYPSLHLQPENAQQRTKTLAGQLQLDVPNPDRAVSPPFERSHPHLPVALENTARVLEFPRPAESPVWIDELAEPVLDRPRIVEAPELLPPPPAMGGILIEQQDEPEPERRLGFDVPLQSASLVRRAVAGAVDAIAVGLAVAMFALIVVKIVGGPLPVRMELAIVGGLIAVCWPAYQYSFLVFCGNTPGLRLTGLHLRKFDGSLVGRSLRRWRVLASLLSAASLGLGYLWCFLDEDELSWHDRITRTHFSNSRL